MVNQVVTVVGSTRRVGRGRASARDLLDAHGAARSRFALVSSSNTPRMYRCPAVADDTLGFSHWFGNFFTHASTTSPNATSREN